MSKTVLVILLFLSCAVSAQTDYDEDDLVWPDSVYTGYYRNMLRADSVLRQTPVSENKIYPKKFSENLISRYQSDEFDYSTVKPHESFWQKLQRKIAQIIKTVFGETHIGSSVKITWIILRLFAVILVGFLLYFIVKYILGKDGTLIFGRKNRKVIINEEELHDNIHEISFAERIARFENDREYRSAVRYQFLFILKKLSDRKLIVWNPEKTNREYEAELKLPHLKNEFLQLSSIFEHVWYGGFTVDEEQYISFRNRFQSFKP